jgi:hypothetical protein
MAGDAERAGDTNVTELVNGIIEDARELFNQQVALLKEEVREELRHARDATLELALGAVVLLIGLIQVSWMLPHLLSWLAPELPMWGCYGLVGCLLAAMGCGALWFGKKTITAVHPLPEQSAQALKENLTWSTNGASQKPK